MKIENTTVFGWERALYGMRNPMESWDKSDSQFGSFSKYYTNCVGLPWNYNFYVPEAPEIGANDMKLMTKLIKGGTEHRKFLRQIVVWVDLVIPIYVWSEFDTYKIGVTRNSCSTMHKLGRRMLAQDDFEEPVPGPILDELNELGARYRQTKDFQLVREMKNILPGGFLQKATISMNYENALNMYYQRKNHRLPQWNLKEDSGIYSICKWIEELPYIKIIIEETGKK